MLERGGAGSQRAQSVKTAIDRQKNVKCSLSVLNLADKVQTAAADVASGAGAMAALADEDAPVSTAVYNIDIR